MDRKFLQDRINATKLQIVAFEDAALGLASGAIESYIIDTGQSRQSVTKINLATLQNAINGLYNRCTMLEARLTGSGSLTVGPAW